MFWKNWTQLPLQEPLLVTDEQNIIKADALFQTFKYMRVDLIISFKDREKNQSLFQKMSDKDAFDAVTIELAVVLEIIAAQVLLFLDQSNLRLIKHNKTSCLKLTHPLQPYFKQNKKKVDESGATVESTSHLLQENTLFKLLQKVVKTWPSETYVEIDDLKKLIFKHVKEKFNQFQERQDDANFRDLCSRRGNNILQKYKKQTHLSLEWSINVEFDQSILTWHIATELCYFSEAPLSTIKSDIRSSRKVSYSISNYTFHLLVTLLTYPYIENIDDLPGKLKRD
ncbi:hypothetical protein V6N11_016993 [Hibiscus sabdariffa]|uniref:Uncharacterized protein n=1 Tax=Hibiscus sabdariffa TaxID=183260 RepID=A0ABR2TWR8_9ROSI